MFLPVPSTSPRDLYRGAVTRDLFSRAAPNWTVGHVLPALTTSARISAVLPASTRQQGLAVASTE